MKRKQKRGGLRRGGRGRGGREFFALFLRLFLKNCIGEEATKEGGKKEMGSQKSGGSSGRDCKRRRRRRRRGGLVSRGWQRRREAASYRILSRRESILLLLLQFRRRLSISARVDKERRKGDERGMRTQPSKEKQLFTVLREGRDFSGTKEKHPLRPDCLSPAARAGHGIFPFLPSFQNG